MRCDGGLGSPRSASVVPGDRVLDVAAGTGNAALLAAERGGRVVGVDFEPALLRVAAKRAREMVRELARVATIQVPVGPSRRYADWGALRRLGRRGDRRGWPASWRISRNAALCVATVTQRSAVSPSGPRSAGPAIRGVAGHMVSDPLCRGDLKGRTPYGIRRECHASRVALRRLDGGRGAMEGSGLALADEAFQGWRGPHMVVRPRHCFCLRSPSLFRMRHVRLASRIPRSRGRYKTRKPGQTAKLTPLVVIRFWLMSSPP